MLVDFEANKIVPLAKTDEAAQQKEEEKENPWKLGDPRLFYSVANQKKVEKLRNGKGKLPSIQVEKK